MASTKSCVATPAAWQLPTGSHGISALTSFDTRLPSIFWKAGVEVNVIRGWLGHASLDTTHRYAEINARAKEAALQACEPPAEASEGFPRAPVWRTDAALLAWLNAL